MRPDAVGRPAVLLAAVWVAAAVYVGARLDRGWVPHDEGAIGHSAERVLAGELPHRDFDEIYTGGLSFLNAAAFRVAGLHLRAPRLALFLVFLAWVPAVFWIASRFTSPTTAALATLLAVAWSLPAYSAAVPSWYNLFFATFGTAALLRYLETERRRWLVAGGAAGGLSCLAKVTGLYFVAAALLFFVYRERLQARASERETTSAGWAAPYRLAATAGLTLLVVLLGLLVRGHYGAVGALHFILPGTALAALLVRHEWSGPPGPDRERFGRLVRLAAPFALGAALPVVLFVAPYVAGGALQHLVTGVFVTPARRLAFAAMDMPDPFVVAAILPVAALVALAAPSTRAGRWLPLAGGLALVTLLLVSHTTDGYRTIWSSMRPLIPFVVIAGVLLLAHPHTARRVPDRRRQQTVLLLAVSALCSLVQFPFAAPIYLLYVAPLGALAALAVACALGTPTGRLAHPAVTAALLFYTTFAVLRLHPGFIYSMGSRYQPQDLTHRLAMDRGGLRVSATDREVYDQVVAVVRQHATGVFAYATPDCPEIYFLSGLRNPTRTVFDFFDPPAGRPARILDGLELHGAGVVVINRQPSFSGPIAAELDAALGARFPAADSVGRFVVRWRP